MPDYRFPSPGVDARFPSPGVDAFFPSPGVDARFVGGKDLRWEDPGFGAALLPSGSEVVFWGDSGYQRGNFATAALVDNKAGGGQAWAMALSRQRGRSTVWYDATATAANRIPTYGDAMANGNTLFSGHNTGYWGDLLLTGLQKRVSQVLSSGAKLIFIRAGSNDAKVSNATAAQIVSGWQARLAQVANINRRVVLETIWPRQVNLSAPAATEVSQAQMAQIHAANQLARANWQAWGFHALVDPWEQLRNLAYNPGDALYGSPSPGATIDGAHMTIRSCLIIGQLQAVAINNLIAPGAWFDRAAGGIFPNWNFATGTGGVLGGGVTGPVPAGMQIQNLSGAGQPVTAVCALTANPATGGNMWTITITSAGGGAADAFQEIKIFNPSTITGFTGTDWTSFVPEIEVDSSPSLAYFQTLITGTGATGITSTRGLAQMGMLSGSAANEYYPTATGINLEPDTPPWNVGTATNVQGWVRAGMRTDIAGTAVIRYKAHRLPIVGNPSVTAPWVP